MESRSIIMAKSALDAVSKPALEEKHREFTQYIPL